MANKAEPMAEVQIETPSQTAGQNSLDILASVWFEPGELHIDGVKISYGFVRAFLEVSDTLDSRYSNSLENPFGHINWRDLRQLENKNSVGFIGNISVNPAAIFKAELSGEASRAKTHTQTSEQELTIPIYTLQSIRSHRWAIFGVASPTQLLTGRVVHAIEQPLVKVNANYKPRAGENGRPICIGAEVKAGVDDLKVIVIDEKSGGRKANQFETEAVTKAIIARALGRGKRTHDDKGQPVPMLLAQCNCTSTLGAE